MKIFISYASEQVEHARAIWSLLSGFGATVWFDKESLIGGQDWDRERLIAQKEADLVVLLCSAETNQKSGTLQSEIRQILDNSRERPLGQTYLIPVRIEKVPLPTEITRFQYIDLFDTQWRFKLAKAVTSKYNQLAIDLPPLLESFINNRKLEAGVTRQLLENSRADFPARADYLTYDASGLYWQYINSEIIASAMSGYYEAERLAKWYRGLDIERERGFAGRWSLTVSEQFRKDEIVSLAFDSFVDYGGAHPSRGVYTLNFGGSDCGKVELEKLVEHNDEFREKVIEFCEVNVNAQIGRGSSYSLEDFSKEDAPDRWEVLRQWSIGPDGFRIYLSEYSGLPFVMGVFEVTLPWMLFEGRLAEDFRETTLGRFILERTGELGGQS